MRRDGGGRVTSEEYCKLNVSSNSTLSVVYYNTWYYKDYSSIYSDVISLKIGIQYN